MVQHHRISFHRGLRGLVSCSCCGKGSEEIKCPFNHRDNYIFEALEQDKNACLTKTGNEIELSKTHQYYYQIQTQLHVSKSNFCNFFVWTRKDYDIERIFPDEDLWSKVVSKCSYYFNMALIPELIGNFFQENSIFRFLKTLLVRRFATVEENNPENYFPALTNNVNMENFI